MQLVCLRSGTLEVSLDSKKKQLDANVVELTERDENKCDVLSVTDRSVDNKDRYIMDSECSQHISSSRKIFSSYTSIHGGEIFMGNSAMAR